MNGDYEPVRELQRHATEGLGSWLYPNARFEGGVMDEWLYPTKQFPTGRKARSEVDTMNDTLTFLHIRYQTADAFEQVQTYYWQQSAFSPEHRINDRREVHKELKRIFIGGPPLFVVNASTESTISVLASLAQDARDIIDLIFTLEVHVLSTETD